MRSSIPNDRVVDVVARTVRPDVVHQVAIPSPAGARHHRPPRARADQLGFADVRTECQGARPRSSAEQQRRETAIWPRAAIAITLATSRRAHPVQLSIRRTCDCANCRAANGPGEHDPTRM
jgi:hypothetical protein